MLILKGELKMAQFLSFVPREPSISVDA